MIPNILINTNTSIYYIEEIYTLNSIFSSSYNRKEIEDFFFMEEHKYQCNKTLKPDSKEWLEQKEVKEKLNTISNHDIKECGKIVLEFMHNNYYNRCFDIYCHTYKTEGYDYDNEESYETETKSYFLRCNHKNCYSLGEILSIDEVTNKLIQHQAENRIEKYINSKKELSKYWDLLRKPIKEYFIKGGSDLYYTNTHLIIGDMKYEISYLDKILNSKFYWDENSQKREFGEHLYLTRLEEYERYKNSIIE